MSPLEMNTVSISASGSSVSPNLCSPCLTCQGGPLGTHTRTEEVCDDSVQWSWRGRGTDGPRVGLLGGQTHDGPLPLSMSGDVRFSIQVAVSARSSVIRILLRTFRVPSDSKPTEAGHVEWLTPPRSSPTIQWTSSLLSFAMVSLRPAVRYSGRPEFCSRRQPEEPPSLQRGTASAEGSWK